MSKYNSRSVTIDGQKFDSQKEAKRYHELWLLQKAGEISGLVRQVRYNLIPAQQGEYRTERACYYIADFQYTENNQLVVEDVKGMRTPEYIIKRKLMLEKHGISIKET